MTIKTTNLVIGDLLSLPDPDTGFMCEWIIKDKAGVDIRKIPCTRLSLIKSVRPKHIAITIPDNYEWIVILEES